MEDVAVRAMHGFGILSQFTENVRDTRLQVAPRPSGGRTSGGECQFRNPGPHRPDTGLSLSIRMNFTHGPGSAWEQAQFENIRLTAEPAP